MSQVRIVATYGHNVHDVYIYYTEPGAGSIMKKTFQFDAYFSVQVLVRCIVGCLYSTFDKA